MHIYIYKVFSQKFDNEQNSETQLGGLNCAYDKLYNSAHNNQLKVKGTLEFMGTFIFNSLSIVSKVVAWGLCQLV